MDTVQIELNRANAYKLLTHFKNLENKYDGVTKGLSKSNSEKFKSIQLFINSIQKSLGIDHTDFLFELSKPENRELKRSYDSKNILSLEVNNDNR